MNLDSPRRRKFGSRVVDLVIGVMKLWLQGRRLKVDFSPRQRSFCLHSLAWTSTEEAEKTEKRWARRIRELKSQSIHGLILDLIRWAIKRVHAAYGSVFFWDLLKRQRCRCWEWHDLVKEDHCSPKWFLNDFNGFPLPTLPEGVHGSEPWSLRWFNHLGDALFAQES